ncbi:MAG: signal recognition particle-docking protein FtsY, partial [Bacteroidia bacterium]
FISRITKAVAGKRHIDEEVLDQLEEALISADVGVKTTLEIIQNLQERVKRDKYIRAEELRIIMRDTIIDLLPKPLDESLISVPKPYIILVVGVNGVGKTTTIGKLAHQYSKAGQKVILGAADTFRAAAVDQLTIWAERTGAQIVKQGMGADPASVAFDTVSSAIAKQADIVIIDTAGRLHNKIHLMNELTKIRSVISKLIPDAPHEVVLVLDGSTGQNAIEQCRQFSAATQVNALAVTKLDGTARGGVVVGISHEFKIPVKYIGVGESINDLQEFNSKTFIDAILGYQP